MSMAKRKTDTVRASRAGHTFHERWAARRTLQLVFPKDNLFAIVVEGLSPNECLNFGQEAEDIADLILYYGDGDTFDSCTSQQILQFKYKAAAKPVTSSYLKKTIKKFSATLRGFREKVSQESIAKKLSFGFVTNATFSDDLCEAIKCLKSGDTPDTNNIMQQFNYLKTWCEEEQISASDIFPIIEFSAATSNLPAQNHSLRRIMSDWSANSSGQASQRLFALTELVREKAQIEGQGNNSIRREDVLDVLGCDEDSLFPAETCFLNVGQVVERAALYDVKEKIKSSNLPVFMHADGGVGKTVFIQSLAIHLEETWEVIVFDCFGGGSYRSEAQARHLPKIGLLQIINELAVRGLCDPLLPTDSDQYGLIDIARKRLKQASKTLQNQSSKTGVLIILDAADNAQLEADTRGEKAFPRLLLASLSDTPIDGVKLLLTARPHRMDSVIGSSKINRLKLEPFTADEIRNFLQTRCNSFTDIELSTAIVRSKGNARVLEYLVESWSENLSSNSPQTEISVEELISEKCEKIFRNLHTAGWSDAEVREFFAALSLLPPPIPLAELAKALGWLDSQVNSAASDLAPMLEMVKHGVIFRDEPTETYIRDHYANEVSAQQSIAQRLQEQQKGSIYAAEALPHFLVVIGDSDRAYNLAGSNEFPSKIETEYGRRRLRLARLYAAFSLATREKDLNRCLSLSMQLSQVASANTRGDQFIRRSPALATILGDSDVSRRLFNDRHGWRGARDTRLIIAYSFLNELEEANIHQKRAIGWVNWYLQTDHDTKNFEHLHLEEFDIAAIMFLNVLKKDFSKICQHTGMWHVKFSLAVAQHLVSFCSKHQMTKGSDALNDLVEFAVSKQCSSSILQIALLSKEYGLSTNKLGALSRAISSLLAQDKKNESEIFKTCEVKLQSEIAAAAMTCLVVGTRESAKLLLTSYSHRRPSSYCYSDRHGISDTWIKVQPACISAWSSGEELTFGHLIPEDIKVECNSKSIICESDFRAFLNSLTVTKNKAGKSNNNKELQKKFASHEQDDIIRGIACILQLVKPIEQALLSKAVLSNHTLADFLVVWRSILEPDSHWRSREAKNNIARYVGLGLAKLLLRHSEGIEVKEAEGLIEAIEANKFSLHDRLSVFALIARRSNLADVAGNYAARLSAYILKDDYIQQRGESYCSLADALLPMSIREAQSYYIQGLAQLDQMGGDDFDLIYSMLGYAAEQSGGWLKPELSHRLMNLCQTIFQHEPSKFGWALFGRAAAASIGFPAVYKLIRWDDQEVVDYSYGLPQLVCYLTKLGHLDARRASVLLTICEDHGWHEWQIGHGLHDLLGSANPKDRAAIFSLVAQKLDQEHDSCGWEGLWKSLIKCLDDFEQLNEKDLRIHLNEQCEAARRKRDIENATYNSDNDGALDGAHVERVRQNEENRDKALARIIAQSDGLSATSLDEAIRSVQSVEGLLFNSTKLLIAELRNTCAYDKRVCFLEALCESTELKFDYTLDFLIESVEEWGQSSVHVNNSIAMLIKKLFEFKGSGLFEQNYSSLSMQIDRLSKLCSNQEFVLWTVLETISRERLELIGNDWLQLATSLSHHADPLMALYAFENLLASSAAKVGDEVGEGAYRTDFSGKSDQIDFFTDIIWHLLGDSDAYVRWSAARSIKGMLDVGLVEDVGLLLERFDTVENLSLVSDEHHFAFLNAQQWLLMGLARAALHHGDKLKPLTSRLTMLAGRVDLHVVNKLHLVRCLRYIEGGDSKNSKLDELWTEIQIPQHGIIECNGWPDHKDGHFDFGFDYNFNKYKIASLARLFWISEGEARNHIADEIKKRWPQVKSMSDLSGKFSYRDDQRYETYPEHVQRHARLFAATTLMKKMPVVKQAYDDEFNPWQEFIKREDVSFEDGSWLSDHKDNIPSQAAEFLLSKQKGNQDTLFEKETLFRKVGFPECAEYNFLPLYGNWTSPDGVYITLKSALVMERGAVKQCGLFAKRPYHDLWLPYFGSDGQFDEHLNEKTPFHPLIWEPEKYPIGIDEYDEWASRGAIARPSFGIPLNELFGLKSDNQKRNWFDHSGQLVLKSEIWGKWRPDTNSRGNRSQDEGSLLWAKRDWLDLMLKSSKKTLIFKLEFRKFSRDYSDSSGIREIYIGLKRSEGNFRFWFAKNASEV